MGAAPKTKVLTITNLGTRKKLTVMLGTLGAPFTRITAEGPFGIPPLGSLGVKIRFTPTVVGPVSQTFNIPSGDVRHPSVNVGLFGNGRPGRLTLPATSFFFGRVGIGVPPGALAFKLSNSGIGKLNGSVGTLSPPFSVALGSGPFSLLPGATWKVKLTFTPESVGPVRSTLAVTSDDPAKPSVNLTIDGTGVAGHLVVNLPPPPSLFFGPVRTGSAMAKAFTITNTAKGLLRGSVGALDPPYSVTLGAGAFALNPGQSRTIRVRFAPTSTGRFPASLVTSVDAPSAPASATIAIGGRGV